MQKESFGIDASACGGALQPGDECIVNVAFTADTLEPRSATAVLFASGAREKRLTTEPAIPCSSGCRLLASGGVSMLATPTNGASSYFTGWTSSDAQEPGCTGSVRECRANIDTNQTITANFGELDNNLIFVSSETFAADLGGTAPYDAACNRLATEAGINDPSGTGYIAAISGAEALSVRVPANVRGWIRMDGLPVADTLAGLLATNTAGPFYPVLLDELGQSHASFEYVMTGTGEDGSLANNCDDWTPGSADSTLLLSPTGVTWGDIAGSCDRPASLLCMGVTKTAPLIAQTYTGKRLWTTATALTVVLLRAVIMRAPILILALLCGCSIDDRAPTVSPGSSGNSSAPGSKISMVADGASIDRAAAAAGAGGLVPGSVLVTDVDVIDFGDSVSGQTFTRPLRVRNAGDTQASGFGATLDGPQRQAFGIETTLSVGNQSPDAFCQASRPAGVVNAAALIASTTRAGGTLLDLEATYVRPDGALVGTGAQLLVGLLTTPLSIANDGSQLTSLDDVWTGGPLRSMSVAEANCNDWTDPASSAAFGDPTDTSSRGFLVANEPCTEPKRVYCVEL